jgi:hypothetical protein
MKIFAKTLMAFAATVTIATTAFAGGVLTNTNQSAAFLRSIARGTSLDPDAVYYNPAGTAFMSNGWHIGLNDQMASQTRSTISTYAPFAMGAANSGMTKEFKGEVFSPVIPSVHLTWKHNRWAVMLGMGVNGGGGTIEYADGLASFERKFAVLPGAINQLGSEIGLSTSQYNMDMLLKGSSMTLAFNAGVSFRITDWLSAAAQIRFSTTSNGYEGHIKNIQVNPNLPAMPALGLNGQMMSASQFFTTIGALRPDLAAQAKWLDCGKADTADCAAKFGNEVSAFLAGTEKWLISGGGAATVVPTVTILKENNVDMANVKIADCFSTADPVLLMLQDPTVQAYGATLYSAPSGVLIGEQILKALKGEPMDAFTAYDLLITEPANAAEIKAQVFPDA